MNRRLRKNFPPTKRLMLIALALLCAGLCSCAQVQVRGQYDVVVGTAHR